MRRTPPAALFGLLAFLLCACAERSGEAPGPSPAGPDGASGEPAERAAGGEAEAEEEETRFLSESHRARAEYYWVGGTGDGPAGPDKPTTRRRPDGEAAPPSD